MIWDVNFESGARLRYHFSWDFVCIVHIFLSAGFFGGEANGFKECFDSWDYWLLVVHSCKFEANMVCQWTYSIKRESQFLLKMYSFNFCKFLATYALINYLRNN